MNELITPQNVMFTVGLLGLLFTVYNYFRNPQIAVEKNEISSNGAIVQLQKDLSSLMAQFQAHISADTVAFQSLNSHIVEVDKSVVKLTTIIDERIPKK